MALNICEIFALVPSKKTVTRLIQTRKDLFKKRIQDLGLNNKQERGQPEEDWAPTFDRGAKRSERKTGEHWIQKP